MSKPLSWQELPIGTVAIGASARQVETGLWRSMRPVIDTDKCISCLKCWVQCPDISITLGDDGKVSGVSIFFCKGCGICAQVCPVSAIAMHPESDFADESEAHGEYPGEVGAHVR